MWPWRVIGGEPGTHRDTRAAPGPPAWPELPTKLLLLGPVGTIPVPPAAAPAKGTGTAMGTRWAEVSPELGGADRDLRHGHSCPQPEQSRAAPSRVVPCRVPTPCPPCPLPGAPLFPTPTPVRGPTVRQRCARGGGGGGGDRGTLVLCHHGAPPAPLLNAALVPHRPRVSPLTFAPGQAVPSRRKGTSRGTHQPRVSPPCLGTPGSVPSSWHRDPKRRHPPARAGPADGHVPGNTSGGHGHASRLFWGG